MFIHRAARRAGGPTGQSSFTATGPGEAYKDVPVIIGGLEASLRRLGHYDYWDDKVRRSIMMDSRADILIYGMGERAMVEIAEALDAGIDVRDITWINGTCVRMKDPGIQEDDVILPDFRDIVSSKEEYCRSFAMQYRSNDAVTGTRLIEKYDGSNFVVQNPPQPPLERDELDELYSLDYMRDYHPCYEKDGGIPAIEEVKFSITANRGCFGGCAFCAITYHQGREVRSRSQESHSGGSEKADKDEGVQRIYPRRGRPYSQFPPSIMCQAAEAWYVPQQRLSLS